MTMASGGRICNAETDETGFGGFVTMPLGIFHEINATSPGELEFQWTYEYRDIANYLEVNSAGS
jgi:hypothetical protein